MDEEAKVSVTQCAMWSGLKLGLAVVSVAWLADCFCSSPLYIITLFSYVGAIVSAYCLITSLKWFRNEVLDGVLPYMRAVSFSCLTVVFGGMILTLASYFFLSSNADFISILNTEIVEALKINPVSPELKNTCMESMKLLCSMSTSGLCSQVFLNFIYCGIFFSFVVALFMKRDQKKN